MHELVTEQRQSRRGYEDSEVKTGLLVAFGAAVVGLVVVGLVASALAFHFFVGRQSLGPPASPFEDVRELPPEPRLQVDAPRDLAAYGAAEEKILESYGWVDNHAGIVRIPIDRAMDLMLQKGYPVRGSSPVGANAGGPRAAAHSGKHQLASAPAGAEGSR